MKRQSVKTILSQGAAGGAFAPFIWLCVAVLWYPNGWNFLAVIFLPFYLVFGAVIGVGSSGAICMSETLAERNWGISLRLIIAIFSSSLLYVLLILFLCSHVHGYIFDPRSFITGAVFGVPIGILTGSNIRPCHMIIHGTSLRKPKQKVLFSKASIRVSRSIEEVRFSFLAGLPLRVASLFGLMVSIVFVSCALSFFLWDDSWSGEPTHLVERLIATAYLAATVIVSFTSRSKSVVLATAVLLNVPLGVWMVSAHGLDADTEFVLVSAFFFIVFWLLFIAGLMIPANKGPVEVEYGHTEIRFGKQQWVRESQ